MKCVEKVAKNVESAITDALIELGATTEEVDIEVLEKGSKGIFGIGAKKAKIRVTLKESVKEIIEEKIIQTNEANKTEESIPRIKKAELNSEEIMNKAESFLGDILEAMNIEGKIDTRMVGDKLFIEISGDKMGVIIGKRGETLDSLQYLTNIVVNKEYQSYIKVMIDTENYRSRREDTLKKLAYKLAKKATQTRKTVMLEPMNPYDRRIIHSALQDSKSVKTHSEGKEPFRRVVITPNQSHKSYK